MAVYQNPKIENTSKLISNLTMMTFGAYFPDSRIFPDENTSTADAITLAIECGTLIHPLELRERIGPCACGAAYKTEPAKKSKLGYRFICSAYHNRQASRRLYKKNSKKQPTHLDLKCSPSIEPTQNTWFFNINIGVVTNLFLAFCWVSGLGVISAAAHAGVSEQCAINWYSMCREVAHVYMSQYWSKNPIGGPGLHVEVDETYRSCSKYNQGRLLKGQLVTIFGLYCRETKQGIFLQVKNKSRAVLWSQMQRYIASGSIICSDGAPMYRNCEIMGFQDHLVVVHKYEFVNRHNSEAHTNGVEIRNRWVKERILDHRSKSSTMSYICEYWYRVGYFREGPVSNGRKWMKPGKCLETFLRHAGEVEPGYGKPRIELLEIGVDEEEWDILGGHTMSQIYLQVNLGRPAAEAAAAVEAAAAAMEATHSVVQRATTTVTQCSDDEQDEIIGQIPDQYLELHTNENLPDHIIIYENHPVLINENLETYDDL